MKTYTEIRIFALGVLAALAANGQSLTGVVTAADTGAPIPAATVVAIQKTASPALEPLVYLSRTDTAGHYAINAAPGAYRVCVQGAGLYVDPCIWGGAPTATVGAAQPVNLALQLVKGWRFILRVHDTEGLLPRVEAVRGQAVSASVTGGPGGPVLLPLIYDDGVIRDYGAVVPQNVALKAIVAASAQLSLTGTTGAAPSAQGIAFQATPPAASAVSLSTRMFPPPDATVVHIYAKGAQ